jgi:hypothetical protein
MIDHAARRMLSQDARRLVTGRMTNDQFDDVYYEQYAESPDRAVAEISSFCYSLYSSDVLWPYRLRGWHAVDAETRSTAARCVLFLRSGREFEWPRFPDNVILRVVAGLAMCLGLPAGIALILIGLTMIADGWDRVVGAFAITGLILLAASSAFLRWWPRFLSADQKAFLESGEHDVWPFLRHADFDGGRKSCHLFRRD